MATRWRCARHQWATTTEQRTAAPGSLGFSFLFRLYPPPSPAVLLGSVMSALRLALAVLSLSGAASFGGIEYLGGTQDPQGGVPHNGNGFFNQAGLPFGSNGRPGSGGGAYNVAFQTSKSVLPA